MDSLTRQKAPEAQEQESNDRAIVAAMRGEMRQSRLHRIRIVTARLLARLSSFPVGAPQAIALLELCSADALEPAQIADRTLIPRQTMTSILDKLEGAGLIVRRDHPTDRRRKLVSLTHDGVATASAIWADLAAYERQTLGGLTDEECVLLDGITTKIFERL